MAYPAGVRVRFSAPNAAHFCYVTAGSLADMNPQHPSTFGTGQLIYFPQNRRHLVEVLQPIRCLVVRLGPQLLSRPGVDSQAMAEPVPVPGWEADWLSKRLRSEHLRYCAEHRGGLSPDAEAEARRAMAVEGIILQLLVLVARGQKERRRHGEVPWLRKVRELIEEQYLSDFRLTDLAAVAGVHRVHLVREFRRNYGLTIGQRIRGLRFEHACELLSRTDLPLREIASVCNFTDHSHFSKQFKKISGITPAEYRNLIGMASISATNS